MPLRCWSQPWCRSRRPVSFRERRPTRNTPSNGHSNSSPMRWLAIVIPAMRSINGWFRAAVHLQFFPGTQAVRKQLLTLAVEDYAKLSAITSEDPDLELERGRALVRLGDLAQMQDDNADAREHYVKARELLTSVTTNYARRANTCESSEHAIRSRSSSDDGSHCTFLRQRRTRSRSARRLRHSDRRIVSPPGTGPRFAGSSVSCQRAGERR